MLRGHGYRWLGFVRVADYTRELLGLSGRTVQEAAYVARRLDELPAVSTAFDRSEITWTQARVICRVATRADEAHWLDVARKRRVDDLQRIVEQMSAADPNAGDLDPDGNEIDGEPAVRWRLACPARVRALWRRAHELASRVAGGRVVGWNVAEMIAAEGFSGRPADVPVGDRVLLESLRLARRARRRERLHFRCARDAATADIDVSTRTAAVPACALAGTEDAVAVPGALGAARPTTTLADAPVPPGVDQATVATMTPVDAFALHRRLLAAVSELATAEPRIGRLLRVLVDHRFYRLIGYPSLETYVRERLGFSVRKAWALLKVDRVAFRSAEFARAYSDGSLSWTAALTILPVLDRENPDAWIARARQVTVRRLCDEVNWVLEMRDVLGTSATLEPPPLGATLASPIGAAFARRRRRAPSGQVDAMAVQIGAHPARDRVAEIRDAEIAFTGPASVVALFRDVLDAFAVPGEPRWAACERLLGHVIAYWENLPQHHDPIFGRDGWRCAVPGCSGRRNLHDHHVIYRGRGGCNEQWNRVSVCASHHLHGIHPGVIRATGSAPDDVHWELGIRWGALPLLTYVGDRLLSVRAAR